MDDRLIAPHSEFENDAETLIKDMEFGLVMRHGGERQPREVPEGAMAGIKIEPREVREGVAEGAVLEPPAEEDDADLELKLAILEIYSERYDRRVDAKALIFDRALTEYKRLHNADRRRNKEERDLNNRIKPFARLQTAVDHEALSDGLLCASLGWLAR
jgi:transcriptional adapter 2-alpha